jgi:hypothetical protein
MGTSIGERGEFEMPVLDIWGIRSKKSIKDGSPRSSSLLSTHQRGDEMVLESMFPCRFLEQRDHVASTTVYGPHMFDIVGKSILRANHRIEGIPKSGSMGYERKYD